MFAFAKTIGKESAQLSAVILFWRDTGQLFDHLLHLDKAPYLIQRGDILGFHAVEAVVEAKRFL